MDRHDDPLDETAPIAGTPLLPALPNPPPVPLPPGPGPVQPTPVLAPPSMPAPTTPAGWYPLYGEQRYWDGWRWTEHRAPAALPAVHASAYYPPAVVTDARVNGAEVTIAWILTLLTLGYLLPWAIAATRGKSNSAAVGLVNLLLGWTFVGWIAALVMACTAHQVVAVHHR